MNVCRSFATSEVPYKAVDLGNSDITENYENMDSAGSFVANDVNVSSSETSGHLTSAICSQPCLVSGDSPEPASTSYISELNHDYQYLSWVNDDAKINSIPDLIEYLATNVKDEQLYYKRSLVFDREDEIYNAMEQFGD